MPVHPSRCLPALARFAPLAAPLVLLTLLGSAGCQGPVPGDPAEPLPPVDGPPEAPAAGVDAGAHGDAGAGEGPDETPAEPTWETFVPSGGEVVLPAWPVQMEDEDAPRAPRLLMGTPTGQGGMIRLFWMPAFDHDTAHPAMRYQVHRLEGDDEAPSDKSLLAEVTGADWVEVGPFTPQETVTLTVVAVDADGVSSGWDEPMRLTLPRHDLMLVDGVQVVELPMIPGARVEEGRIELPAGALDNLGVVPARGVVLAFLPAQVEEHRLALQMIRNATPAADGGWVLDTLPVRPSQLLLGTIIEPEIRLVEPEWYHVGSMDSVVGPDGESWWEGEAVLGSGHWVERTTWAPMVEPPDRATPKLVPSSCLGSAPVWWECARDITFGSSPSARCSLLPVGRATFPGSGTLFTLTCGLAAGTGGQGATCDFSQAPSAGGYAVTSVAGIDIKYCLGAELLAQLQGQASLGGAIRVRYDNEDYNFDIGDGDLCQQASMPGCASAEERARAAERNVGEQPTTFRLSPRVYGGVDLQARVRGVAGVSASRDIFDVYRTIRPTWFLWFSVGVKATAEFEAIARAEVEGGVRVDFDSNVGLDMVVAHDRTRTPRFFNPDNPSQGSPGFTFLLSPRVTPRFSAEMALSADGGVRLALYVLVESTLYLDVGPKASITLDAAATVLTPAQQGTSLCGAVRVNQFDLKFKVTPSVTFEVRVPFTSRTVFARSWDISSLFTSTGRAYEKLLGSLPTIDMMTIRPGNLPQMAIASPGARWCPTVKFEYCGTPQAPRGAWGLWNFDFASTQWVASPSLQLSPSRRPNCVNVEVLATVGGQSTAGTTARISMQGNPVRLPLVNLCGQHDEYIGNFADGCRWNGDGTCSGWELCGSVDCPIGQGRCQCGDGICRSELGDNCRACPADCGACGLDLAAPEPGFVRIIQPGDIRVGGSANPPFSGFRMRMTGGTGGLAATLNHDFHMMDHEVSQQEYFDAANPTLDTPLASFAACRQACGFARETCPASCPAFYDQPGASLAPCPDCPVERVTLVDTLRYANARSRIESLTPCYAFEPATSEAFGAPAPVQVRVAAPDHDMYRCIGYRLPSELEWEYGARVSLGTVAFNDWRFDHLSRQDNGDPALDVTAYANYAITPGVSGRTVETCTSGPGLVCPRIANSNVVWDLQGNVGEWVMTDDAQARRTLAQSGNQGRIQIDLQARWMVRGGSFHEPVERCALGFWGHFVPAAETARNVGFRLVRTAYGPNPNP